MRILYVAGEFAPTPGGISVFSSNLLDQLLKRGHSLFLCAPEGSTVALHNNLKKVYFYPNSHRLRQLSLAFLKQVITCPVDVVFFSQFLGSSWMGILLLSRIAKIPAVALCHGWELQYLKWHPTDSIALRMGVKTLTLGLANSNFCRDAMLRVGIEGSRLGVLNPGTNLDMNGLERITNFRNSSITLLTVCRIERLKGIDLVIETMGQLKNIYPQLVYKICGNIAEWGQSYYASLLSKVKQYGLEGRVFFIGHVPVNDTCPIYEQADIYVSPSRVEKIRSSFRAESFGITFLEAAAACLPVIATRVGGIPDAVEDGVTGILIDNENVEELTVAVKYLVDNPAIAVEMGKNGRERVKRNFTWEKVGERLDDYLESALGRRGHT